MSDLFSRGWNRFAVTGLTALSLSPAFAQAAAEPVTLPPVEVVGVTILPGIGTPLDQVPANIQTLRQREVGNPRNLNAADALNRSAGSVNINDTAGNPFQHDLNFRGFTASPQLGTPQGLSVFMDGVRVNEVFGDTVDWDLIPNSAISSITVIPGSNPVFGLNTLGGALNVATKSGTSNPGTSIRVQEGSFGRKAFEFETGDRSDRLDYFVTGKTLRERGWGEHNPSRVEQLFGKAGFHESATDVDLSISLANNRLEGNQSLPLSFLDDIRQSYSWPDYQTNRLAFVNLKLAHHFSVNNFSVNNFSVNNFSVNNFSDDMLLEAGAYYRKLETYVLNSNVNNDYDTSAPVGPGNQPTGNAINQINQYRPGASVQLTSLARLAGHPNHWVAGASVDGGRTGFSQWNQEAASSRDTTSDSPTLRATALQAKATSTGAFVTDDLGLDDKTFLTLSGRYNHATVKLEDQIGTSLNGEHSFNRINPAIGIAYNPTTSLTAYASYNEGMRVPTPVELTCADPNAPCSLPNAFSSDPALKPVISRTLEFGARGHFAPGFGWSAAIFRTRLQDDIEFISSGGGATSAGYFQNVGQTRRQGVELAFDARTSRVTFNAHYSYVSATYRSPLVLNSPSNSTAGPLSCPTCTEIQVETGDRIPGVPRHIFKLGADLAFTPAWSVGANLIAQSSQYSRGDENNRDVNGPVPGFATIDIDTHFGFARGWELFANVNNLFDRRYSTFGSIGQNVFTGPGKTFDTTGSTWRNEQFRSTGAPRGVWVGLNYRFGDPAK